MKSQQPWRIRQQGVVMVVLAGSLMIEVVAQNDLPTLSGIVGGSDPTEAAGSTTATRTGTAAATETSDSNSAAATSDATDSAAATSSTGAMPSLSTAKPSIPHLTGLPSLSGAFDYPPPTVPPTANAPYMQKSNLPEGTVFICVGAGLAFIGLVMIAWRLAVRWMVNRSVKKAAISAYTQDTKTLVEADRKSRFYSHSPDSTLSMERLTKTGRPISTAPKQPPSANLFFSPTAGAGMHNVGNRNSSGYLPAGYYSMGNASAASGMPTTQIGGGGPRRPQSEAYSNVPRYEDSPQSSPGLPPRLGPQDSVSNISSEQSTRTPSNYLDDLMSIPPLPPPRGNGGNGKRRPQSEYSRR